LLRIQSFSKEFVESSFAIGVFAEHGTWYETPLRDGFHSNNAWKQDEAW